MHEDELAWEALEYEHVDKTADWYWGLGLIALLGVALAIFFENLLFAAVILLITLLRQEQNRSRLRSVFVLRENSEIRRTVWETVP